jgi:hypothetical protein
VSRNRVRRRIFGREREGVTGGMRKLHNEELLILFSSSVSLSKIKLRE